MVGVYRKLIQANEHLSKGKNREAIKAAGIGLGHAALLLASTLSGVPGLFSIGAEGAAVSLAAESFAKQAGSSATSGALGAVETESVVGTEESIAAASSASGAIGVIITKKAGSLEAAAKTMMGLVPGVAIAQNLGKAAKTAKMSQDEWNKKRAELIATVEDVMNKMGSLISGVDWDEYGSTTIKVQGSKLKFTTKVRTLNEIHAKYELSAATLKQTISDWDDKHGEHRHLLSAQESSQDSSKDAI